MNEETLTPEDREKAIEAIVSRIRQYGLQTPAIFFLEMHRPLAGIAGLAAHAISPLFGAFLGMDMADRYVSMIDDRDTLNEIVSRLGSDTGEPAETRP